MSASPSKSILDITTEDSIINEIFKNQIQNTHIQGDVNLCVKRCGQEIDGCHEVNFANMTNHGKVMVLNKREGVSGNAAKCNIRKAFDDDDHAEFSTYEFEKMFVMTPSFHKIESVIYDAEFGLIFSKSGKDGKKRYMVLCIFANSASEPKSGSELLFYKLTDALFGMSQSLPEFSSKREINSPPNPVQLSNFLPPIGERSFYEYTYDHSKSVCYRIFQKPMGISAKVLNNLRQKLMPQKMYGEYKTALQAYENNKRGLVIFYKEDYQTERRESMENENTTISEDGDEPFEVEKSDNEGDEKKSDEVKKSNNDPIPNVEMEKSTDVIEKASNQNDEPVDQLVENTTLKMYINIIMNILFVLSANVYLSYRDYLEKGDLNADVNVDDSFIHTLLDSKMNLRILDNVKFLEGWSSKLYIVSKGLNTLFVLITIVLTFFIVMIGTVNNFSDALLTKSKDFIGLNVAILVFTYLSLGSMVIQRWFKTSIDRTITTSTSTSQLDESKLASFDQFFHISPLIRAFTQMIFKSEDTNIEECLETIKPDLTYEMYGGNKQSGGGKSSIGYDGLFMLFVFIFFIIFPAILSGNYSFNLETEDVFNKMNGGYMGIIFFLLLIILIGFIPNISNISNIFENITLSLSGSGSGNGDNIFSLFSPFSENLWVLAPISLVCLVIGCVLYSISSSEIYISIASTFYILGGIISLFGIPWVASIMPFGKHWQNYLSTFGIYIVIIILFLIPVFIRTPKLKAQRQKEESQRKRRVKKATSNPMEALKWLAVIIAAILGCVIIGGAIYGIVLAIGWTKKQTKPTHVASTTVNPLAHAPAAAVAPTPAPAPAATSPLSGLLATSQTASPATPLSGAMATATSSANNGNKSSPHPKPKPKPTSPLGGLLNVNVNNGKNTLIEILSKDETKRKQLLNYISGLMAQE